VRKADEPIETRGHSPGRRKSGELRGAVLGSASRITIDDTIPGRFVSNKTVEYWELGFVINE